MEDNKQLKIQLNGHTDDVGSLEPTDDCYIITGVYLYGNIPQTNWDKLQIRVVDKCVGLTESYTCRYNEPSLGSVAGSLHSHRENMPGEFFEWLKNIFFI